MSKKKNSQKTTPEHFEIFKKEVRHWLEAFGLKGWEVFFKHAEPPEPGRGYIGYSLLGRVATFYLAPKWENYEKPIQPQEVARVAFHETCELVLARLYILARERFIREDEIKEEIHHIIRTLENVILPCKQSPKREWT